MILNTFWLWVAAVASFATWAIHTFIGGPQIVRPLFEADLKPMPKYVLYFVWHIVTILLFVMALGYVLAALYPPAWPLAVQSTGLALLIGLLNGGIAIRYRLDLKTLPQWMLFLVVTLLGAAAIWL